MIGLYLNLEEFAGLRLSRLLLPQAALYGAEREPGPIDVLRKNGMTRRFVASDPGYH